MMTVEEKLKYEAFMEKTKTKLKRLYELIDKEETKVYKLCNTHEYRSALPFLGSEAGYIGEARASIDMAITKLGEALEMRKKAMAKLEEKTE